MLQLREIQNYVYMNRGVFMIDKKIFESVEYFKILKELLPSTKINFTIDDYTISYFEKYKNMENDDDEWIDEYFENAQIFFNTEFIYEIDSSQYVGIYTDLDANKFIVNLYHGGEFEFLGDTITNWIENKFTNLSTEELNKFKDSCYSLFGVDIIKKFNATEPFEIRVIPSNNKLLIGQEVL